METFLSLKKSNGIIIHHNINPWSLSSTNTDYKSVCVLYFFKSSILIESTLVPQNSFPKIWYEKCKSLQKSLYSNTFMYYDLTIALFSVRIKCEIYMNKIQAPAGRLLFLHQVLMREDEGFLKGVCMLSSCWYVSPFQRYTG